MGTQSNAVDPEHDCFVLKASSVELAITKQGGHLGPVTFFPHSAHPIRPYALAPWTYESVSADVLPVIRILRGDWFCSAFGANSEGHRGRQLPLHGETANNPWCEIARTETDSGVSLRIATDLPLQGGRCEATTTLLKEQSVIYQRHDLIGLSGPCNPGHHATLAFPDTPGAATLSFSSFIHARSYFNLLQSEDPQGWSFLTPDVEITDLHRVPCTDGSMTDLTRYPARRGFDDVVLLCADPTLGLAWSAVTFPEQRFVWFALRDPSQLASTLLWFSNGGRRGAPWSGRHVNVLGLEDITSYFHVGLAASCGPNLLNELGIRTVLEPDPVGRLSISYIQGVARIPPDFDRVATVQPQDAIGAVVLTSRSGVVVEVPCHVGFTRTGMLPQRG